MSSQFARKQTEIADTALGMETKIKDGQQRTYLILGFRV